jgi:hypothetical protein
MSIEEIQRPQPAALGYEVVRKDPSGGVAILADPKGQYELWERVDGYRGDILVIDGAEYRFGRTWRGAPSGN